MVLVELKVQVVLLVLRGNRVPQALQANLVVLAPLAQTVLQDQVVLQVVQVPQAHLVLQVQMAPQDQVVLQVWEV